MKATFWRLSFSSSQCLKCMCGWRGDGWLAYSVLLLMMMRWQAFFILVGIYLPKIEVGAVDQSEPDQPATHQYRLAWHPPLPSVGPPHLCRRCCCCCC